MKMKMNVTSKVHVDQRLLHEIQTQVNETVAIDVNLEIPKKQPVFCVADLWNIHKQKRQRSSRRHL